MFQSLTSLRNIMRRLRSNMLVIGCLDGAFGLRGFTQRLKQRDYMSDIVREVIIDVLYEFGKSCSNIEFKSGRGSLFYAEAMREYLQANSYKQNNVLLIGKSNGAHYINRLAKEFENKIYYNKKRLILVDPCWFGRNGNNIYPPLLNYDIVYNFYQLNERFLNGAWIPRELLSPQIKQKELKNCDHWNIISAPEIKKSIRESLISLS